MRLITIDHLPSASATHHQMQWFLHILAPQNEPSTITGHHQEVSTCVCVRTCYIYVSSNGFFYSSLPLICGVKIIDLHVTLINPCVPKTRSLGRLRCRWEENIKIDLQDVGLGGGRHGLDRSGSGYGQVAGTCECSNEPSGSIKRREFLDKLRTG